MPNTSATLRGIHNVKSCESAGVRSIPHSSKSAFLDLFSLRNREERLLQEKAGLKMRKDHVNKELGTIKRNIARLLGIALKSTKEMSISATGGKIKKHKASTVLEY